MVKTLSHQKSKFVGILHNKRKKKIIHKNEQKEPTITDTTRLDIKHAIYQKVCLVGNKSINDTATGTVVPLGSLFTELYLAWSWHPDGARPIVVHVSELVGKPLENVWLPARIVIHHVVVGRCHCSLANVLAHQEKIKPTHQGQVLQMNHYYTNLPSFPSDGVVHYSAWGRIR